jgi:hypothetical protein
MERDAVGVAVDPCLVVGGEREPVRIDHVAQVAARPRAASATPAVATARGARGGNIVCG